MNNVQSVPMKVRSTQAGFTFLDLILLIRDSVDRLILNYCNKNPPKTLTYRNKNPPKTLNYRNKNPPKTPNEPRFECPPNVQVNFVAERSIGR